MSWLSEWLDKLLHRRPPPPVSPPPVSPPGDFRARMLARHNHHRAGAGLPPLAASPLLDASAQREADCCARLGRLDHNCGGTNPWQRISATGYAWVSASENIAMGQRSPEAAVDDWLADPPHRANVLGAWDDVGFGLSGSVWVADYGRR